MRTCESLTLLAALLAAVGLTPLALAAEDVLAHRPSELSVTLYRAPYRASQALDLNDLQGFALVTETRTVSLPAGESRVRFEGVADGIEPASAILAGLPAGVLLEKNRDARVLSPSALVAASLGRSVDLERTDPKTGRTTRTTGTLRADNNGVVFESAQGIEALRCSGLPETFEFSGTTELAPTPTLSVRVRSERPVSTQVTLSYLAHGFDWTATYTATVSPDARTMDLGAWVTLANGNGVSFPAAHAQIVAGRLNRASGAVEPLDTGGAIFAQCWPRGTTTTEDPAFRMFKRSLAAGRAATPSPVVALEEVVVTGTRRVEQEQLGDLKLYRVPEPTSVSSRQMKQVRLLDREGVPVELLYGAELPANEDTGPVTAHRVLRTRNDTGHHLGLPLPSGIVDSFTVRSGASLLLNEAPLRDIAVNEEFEVVLGDAPDVRVRQVLERAAINSGSIRQLPLLPGIIHLRSAAINNVSRIEISNASGAALTLEMRLDLPDGTQLIRAYPAPIVRNSQRVFRVNVPASGQATVRYQTEHISQELKRD